MMGMIALTHIGYFKEVSECSLLSPSSGFMFSPMPPVLFLRLPNYREATPYYK